MAAIMWHDHWLPGTMARCKAIIRARGCKARHQKQLDSTVSFLDRPEFRNFAKCAPDAVPPATEPASGWDPAVEPASGWDPAVEPASGWDPAVEPASGWDPAVEPEVAQAQVGEPGSNWRPAAEPAQSWEPISEPIQSWSPAEDPPPPPPLPLPLVEPGEE
jgi:hypothetical protein